MNQVKERQPERGQLLIERGRDGWLFVQIGRYRGVKRFNLSDAEARQLMEQLGSLLRDPS